MKPLHYLLIWTLLLTPIVLGANYAIVNSQGLVTNIIVGSTTVQSGFIVVPVGPSAGIGATWNGSTFIAPTPVPTPTPFPAQAQQNTFNAAVSAGFPTGLGWSLPLDATARGLITSGATLINTALLSMSGNTNATNAFLASNYTFTDNTGTAHTVTVSQAIQINIAYGQYYQQIWNASVTTPTPTSTP